MASSSLITRPYALDHTRRRWLLIDADPVRIADVSSTDAEKATAEEAIKAIRVHLRQQDWPAPLLADSGNGYHLLYRINVSADDAGLIERSLKGLAALFDSEAVKIDSTVFNPSRIVKLYGTVSRKGDHTPERTHRQSRILHIPDSITQVPIELLEALAATAESSRRPRGRAMRGGKVINRARKYLAALPPAVSGQNGHAATFRAACAAVLGFDLSPDDAYSLLGEWNQSHCDPPWEEHELRHKLEDADKKPGERGYLLKAGNHRNGRAFVEGTVRQQPRASSGNGRSSSDKAKPEIDAGSQDLQVVTAQAWDAIRSANDPPFLFRYGGAPSRTEQDDQGEPIIRLVDEDRMRHTLARVARWFKVKRSGDDMVIVDAMPPKEVVKDVLATPDMPLPILMRIVEAPVFAKDGTLLTTPGYHPASQTFYVPAEGFNVPQVSDRPSAEEIDEARLLICYDLLVDFPFTNDAERAHAVALLLLPFARDLIPGPTPLHLFEKPMPGTGATLLVDMLSYPATGRPIPTMTEGRDEEEWRKRLTAKLRNSPQFVLIDNLRQRLDSGAVSAAITSPIWEDRILSQSVTLKVHARCCWLATGNNPAVSSEMARRIIRIRLDAKMDRPWLREDFKHPDLRRWARENRGRLTWAALTLIRAWFVAGGHRGGLKLGMFEEWSEVMGGILEVAGISGFLSNLNEFYEESDAEVAQWRSFVLAWWMEYGTREVGTADLFQLIGNDVILPLGDGADQSRKVRLGQMLTQERDRTFSLEAPEGEATWPIELCIRRGDRKQRATNGGWRELSIERAQSM